MKHVNKMKNGKYAVRLKVNGVNCHMGVYETFELAAAAARMARLHRHEGKEAMRKAVEKIPKKKAMLSPQERVRVMDMAKEASVYKSNQPCWDCANACGGCSWSRKLIPIEGWTAKKVPYRTGGFTYRISCCPQFIGE